MAPFCAWKRKRGVAVSAVKQLILVLDLQRYLPENICSLRFCSLQGKHRAWDVADYAKIQQTNSCHCSCWDFSFEFHLTEDFVFKKSYDYDESRSILATLSDT